MGVSPHILKTFNKENVTILVEPEVSEIKDAINSQEEFFIACENPIGLRYLNGSKYLKDDSYALNFDNLHTRNEWIGMIAGAMSECCTSVEEVSLEFFYPYPDYETVNEIFSEMSIDSMGYGKQGYNVWDMKLDVYDEKKLGDKLSAEGVMSSLANCFLIYVSKNGIHPNLYYAKISHARKDEFAIGTRILETDGDDANDFIVEKYPLYEVAEKHIEALPQKAEDFNEASVVKVISPEVIQGIARYEFIKGTTLKKMIKESDNPCELIYQFYDRLFESENKYKNLDLIFDNVFVTDEGYKIIDGEWIFGEEVIAPDNYIIWIGMNDLSDPNLTKEVFAHYGISELDDVEYRNQADKFAREYVGCGEYEKNVKFLHKLPFERIADIQRKMDAGAVLTEPAKRNLAGRVIHKLTSLN